MFSRSFEFALSNSVLPFVNHYEQQSMSQTLFEVGIVYSRPLRDNAFVGFVWALFVLTQPSRLAI